MNVLIINGHPTMETSNANKAILEEVKRLLPEAEVSNLQALYPNYQIDVDAEQAKLVKADVIVWQPCLEITPSSFVAEGLKPTNLIR